jgi:hypothetical protein
LHSRITRRLRELRDLMGDYVEEQPLMPDLADQLRARVKSAHLSEQGEPELEKIEHFLGEALATDLLGADIVAGIRDLLRERRALIHSLQATAMAAVPEKNAGNNRFNGQPREIWNVAEALADSGEGVRLFVDGYNVILRLPELAAIESAENMAAARKRLGTLCRTRAGLFSLVEIVFDGVGALSQREKADGIVIVYSPDRHDSQNADIYLVERLRQTADSTLPAWLVTDDFGLREQAKGVCDAYISTLHFHRFLTGSGRG